MSTLDLTVVEHLTVCRARCTRDCQHGHPRTDAMEVDPTFCEHPQVHYPSAAAGYSAEQARVGASVVCASCLVAIGGSAVGGRDEERAIANVWRGFIRVRDYVLGWHAAANVHKQPGGNPDEPTPDAVYCLRCEQDFPTLINWGNYTIEPDPRAELRDLLAALEAERAA